MNRFLSLLFVSLTFIQCKPTNVSKSLTTLENTKWVLSEMNGMPVLTPENGKIVHFILSADGGKNTIKGFAGCNSIMGSYTLSGADINITIASTMMMCPDQKMEIEKFFTTALTVTDSYKLEGDVLQLFEGDTSVAIFNNDHH